jgi:4-amino-4-deoxy-L-arabinose transferase-like glycosyltransferase
MKTAAMPRAPAGLPPAAQDASAAPPPERALIGVAAAFVAVLHVLVSVWTPYEFHRDEFLYMAMGRNLRLFAMDFPPLIALLSEAQRGLLGDSLWSLRLAPGLAHAALVALAGLLAWRVGGGRFAQLLAMVPVATAPLFLRAGSLFQPVVFDQLWWTLALYALVVLAGTRGERLPAPRDWVFLGCAAGLGLLTKFSIVFLGFGVLCALVLARRTWLRTRGPWVAVGLALLIGAPSWIGQIRLGAPVVGQMGDLRETQLERIGYGDFLLEFMLMQGPAALLLAIAGAAALLASRRLAPWRVVGWSCVAAFLVILLLRGKPYYAGPVLPALYAAGAVAFAAATARFRAPWRPGARAAGAVLVAGWGLAVLPLGLPILPPEPMARFAAATGVTAAVRTNAGQVLALPQDYADMLGWERKVARIALAYHALPPRDREDAVVVTANYGQAGAVDFYGPRHGLPGAVAPVGSYWFWGPGEKPGRVILKVGDERADLEPFCASIALAARISDRWVVPEEQDLGVWVCREPVATLQEVWPRFRGRN